MHTEKNNNDHILVIDDITYKFLLDLEDELGEDYRSFINKVLSSKVIKKKFILLQGLQRKISRVEILDGLLDQLASNIERDIDKLTPEESVEYYQTLSQVYTNDVKQLKGLFTELIERMIK